MTRNFTGWHMAAIMVAFFGVVGTVNFTMARYASSTFGGVVVQNSYVASQEFNDWLEAARAQAELGWLVTPTVTAQGRVAVALEGVPAGAVVTGYARHPLGRQDDLALTFGATPQGFVSQETLPEGRWVLRYTVEAGTDSWRGEEELRR